MHALTSHGGIHGDLIVRADVSRVAQGLRFDYRVEGEVERLRIAPQVPAERADELWRTTCFEGFVARADEPGYREYNFAPSSQWAAYGFSGYREGMAPLADVTDVAVSATTFPDRVEVTAVAPTPNEWESAPLIVGICAILEDREGNRSYWALAHAPGEAPDFHHGDCFALPLGAGAHA